VLRRFHIQRRDDYVEYSRLSGKITKLVSKLKGLKSGDPFRIEKTEEVKDLCCRSCV